MNKLDQAFEKFKEAVAMQKDQPSISYHLALTLYKQGDYEKALDEVNRAISMDKEFPEKEDAQNLLKELTK